MLKRRNEFLDSRVNQTAFNSNSPTGLTFTASSTFVSTRGLIRIRPGFASRGHRP